MGVFRYSGFDAGGRSVAGTIDAPSERNALELLSEGGIIPTEVIADANGTAVAAPGAAPARRRRSEGASTTVEPVRGRRGRVPLTVRVLFVRELATFLQADVTLLEALDVLHRQEAHTGLRAILGDVHHRVQGGEAFSAALARWPRVFPPLLISMTRVGETGGMLGKVLDQMATWMEHEEEVRGEIRNAMAYPVLIVCLGVLTIAVLTSFVLPRITGIFAGMNIDLPLLTRVLMGVSGFMGRWWWLVFGSLLVVGLGLYQYLKTDSGKALRDRLSLSLPVLGTLTQKSSIARFSRASAALLGAGVPLLETLRVVRGLIGNQVMAAVVDETVEKVTSGGSLARTLGQSKYFPPAVTHLLAVGERTGRLSEMFDRVALTFERQARGQIKVLLELLAPILIVCLAVVVGTIALSILLPIMQLNQLMR